LERTAGSPQPNTLYYIDEFIVKRRVRLSARIVRITPNEELELAVSPALEPIGGFYADAKFKLFPEGEYTRVSFSSQTKYAALGDQVFEPILTYAVRRKVREDLRRLKLMLEAEPASR
jgi:hypothetical protein